MPAELDGHVADFTSEVLLDGRDPTMSRRELRAVRGRQIGTVFHDLALVRDVSDRVAVMYLGRVVEVGTREQIHERPTHPFTQSLMSAVPVPDLVLRGRAGRLAIAGVVPDPPRPPSGCRFRTRCCKARAECAGTPPELVTREGSDHPSACLFAGTDGARTPAPPSPR